MMDDTFALKPHHIPDATKMVALLRQPAPVPDPSIVYSIGFAVDLVEIKAAMDEFSREPWDLPPAFAPEPPTDD